MAVLAVIGLFLGVRVIEQPLVGVGIAVLALLGGLYLLRRESADEGDFFEAPIEEAEEPGEGAFTQTATAEPLAAWEPTDGLATWSPPEESGEPDILVEEVEVLEDEEPLDLLDLEELEHIDEFVEAEAAEQAEATFEGAIEEEEPAQGEAAHAPVIEEIEDVHSDDDIMKASAATELSVTAPEASDNSELAKLLAKVQSRLAAYE